MNILQQTITEHAKLIPQKIALKGDSVQIIYQQLPDAIELLWSELLSIEPTLKNKPHRFAFLLDNHPSWAILDLTLFFKHQCAIPLPHFFSTEQLEHALSNSQANILIIEASEKKHPLIEKIKDKILSIDSLIIAGKNLLIYVLAKQEQIVQIAHDKIVKITYTSGTTAHPKGVALSEQAILAKVIALAEACQVSQEDISLSILPLSTLLENLGGLYVPLLCGASITLLSPEQTGLKGSSQLDAKQLLSSLDQYQPTAFIIIPQLLQLFIKLVSSGHPLPDSLRYIAMGGAPVSQQLLTQAEQLKIPVFEGYGLSEASSVVSVNRPGHNQIGSVGQVLNCHDVLIQAENNITACFDQEGEILVKGHLFNGYLGEQQRLPDDYYATGDIGKLNKDGYLFITGRKKNIINTSYGRNISPEWIEKELEIIPEIAQCLIYGHSKPFLVALLVLRATDNANTNFGSKDKIAERVKNKISDLNQQLPDYARIKDSIILKTPFSLQNNQLTGTGRPKRTIVYKYYNEQLERCYEKENRTLTLDHG